MDRKPRNFQPQAAELETKVMLSVAATPPPADAEVTTLDADAGSAPAPPETVTGARPHRPCPTARDAPTRPAKVKRGREKRALTTATARSSRQWRPRQCHRR